MRRRFRSKPTVRTITVKYAGKCACCGAVIKPGDMADYYPIGTIQGVQEPRIAHVQGLQGNSARCAEELKKRRIAEVFDDFDARWEDDCKDRCGL